MQKSKHITKQSNAKTPECSALIYNKNPNMQLQKSETHAKNSLANKIKLPKFEDENQKKAFKNIAYFMALMLIFTIVAKGTSGATLPKVELVAPASGEIIEDITISGKIEAAQVIYPNLPGGLIVEQIFVVPGQAVNKGDKLFMLDISHLNEEKQRTLIALENLELHLENLLHNEPYDNSIVTNAQLSSQWAKQDLDAILAQNKNAISAASNAVENARTSLSNAETDYMQDPTPENEQLIYDYKNALENAEAILSETLNSASSNEESARRTLTQAEQNLKSAQTSDMSARQTMEEQKAQNALEAELVKLDIEKQKQLLELFNSIDENGIVTAQTDGILMETGYNGMLTGEQPVITLADTTGGYRAVFNVSTTEKEIISSSSNAQIIDRNDFFEEQSLGTAELISVYSKEDDTMATATYSLPEGNWLHGKQINMQIIKNRDTYSACLPLHSVHHGQNGTYVLIMEEASGILGIENTVRSIPVEIIATDGSIAAVNGNIGFSRNIISTSTKPIEDGDKVRVEMP